MKLRKLLSLIPMKRIHRIGLALLSALFLSIPFFSWGTGLFLFVAFIPLLLIEDDMAKKAKGSITWYALLTFGVFVTLTTYWVYFATWIGIVASIIVNGGYMALTFWVFHRTRKKLGDRLGYASLAVFWLTFEFLYLRAQVNFPWLVLGNGFANDVILIQWYEVTGALGGTLWALVLNILLFKLVRNWLKTRSFSGERKQISWALGFFLIPLLFSVIRYATYEEKDDPYEMVVLQPNIDPYAKFVDLPQEEQTAILLRLADSLVGPSTEYIVGPETFINQNVWQTSMHLHPEVIKLYDFLKEFPEAKLVLGATTYKLYMDPSEYTPTSRPINDGQHRYDSFNSAFQLDRSDTIQIYHKSMQVTGVEKMPHAKLLKFLTKLTIKLGGTMRSHGTQAFRSAFVSPRDGTSVGPVICWESVFGEYVTEYVSQAGANFLFIITNDGWWRNTPGHRQHNAFARLRAIENRRSVARSANTGISSLIDQRGRELARTGWWEESGLVGSLNKNDHLTFYTRHGDFLGRIASLLTAILLLYAFVFRFIKKN